MVTFALIRDDTIVNIILADSEEDFEAPPGTEALLASELPEGAGIGSARDGDGWTAAPPPLPQWPRPQSLFIDGRAFWVENGSIVRELTQDEIDALEQSVE